MFLPWRCSSWCCVFKNIQVLKIMKILFDLIKSKIVHFLNQIYRKTLTWEFNVMHLLFDDVHFDKQKADGKEKANSCSYDGIFDFWCSGKKRDVNRTAFRSEWVLYGLDYMCLYLFHHWKSLVPLHASPTNNL